MNRVKPVHISTYKNEQGAGHAAAVGFAELTYIHRIYYTVHTHT